MQIFKKIISSATIKEILPGRAPVVLKTLRGSYIGMNGDGKPREFELEELAQQFIGKSEEEIDKAIEEFASLHGLEVL